MHDKENDKQSSADNSVTGAVTGGGHGSLTWLFVLLGIIVVLLGLWLIIKKR